MPTKIACDFVAETTLTLSADGELYVYISDGLAPHMEDCEAACQWAHATVAEVGDEQSLALVVDIPKTIDELLDLYRLFAYEDEIVLETKNKHIVDGLRTKFQAVLDKLNSVKFE